MASTRITAIVMGLALTGIRSAAGDLVISEFLANPSGSDSPKEYVELVATGDINFSATPYAVVFTNNGTATSDGWAEGGRRTYAFSINSGTVGRGDVVYLGGSGAAPILSGGTTLRSLHTGTSAGDAFGNPSNGGVLGNGGSSADGIAVFNVSADSITSSLAPVDAIFFGDSAGGAFVNNSSGYALPNNDHYSGGVFQTSSFLFADGGSAEVGILAGTFDTTTDSWTVGRTLSYTGSAPSFGASSLVLTSTAVPEPGTFVLALLAAVPAAVYRFRRRRTPNER